MDGAGHAWGRYEVGEPIGPPAGDCPMSACLAITLMPVGILLRRHPAALRVLAPSRPEHHQTYHESAYARSAIARPALASGRGYRKGWSKA